MSESKKKYLELVVTCIKFETDVITASSGGDYQTDGVYDGTGEWGGFYQ